MLRHRLSYSNVVSTLALTAVIVGGGGVALAVATNSVRSPHIVDGAIRARDLHAGAVNSSEIRRDSITGAKVQNGSLSGRDLAPRAEGTVLAGMNVAADGTVFARFNRLGDDPLAERVGLGRYVVHIPGAHPAHIATVIASVAPVATTASCIWTGTVEDGRGFGVSCQSASGTLKDAQFVFILFDASMLSGPLAVPPKQTPQRDPVESPDS